MSLRRVRGQLGFFDATSNIHKLIERIKMTASAYRAHYTHRLPAQPISWKDELTLHTRCASFSSSAVCISSLSPTVLAMGSAALSPAPPPSVPIFLLLPPPFFRFLYRLLLMQLTGDCGVTAGRLLIGRMVSVTAGRLLCNRLLKFSRLTVIFDFLFDCGVTAGRLLIGRLLNLTAGRLLINRLLKINRLTVIFDFLDPEYVVMLPTITVRGLSRGAVLLRGHALMP